MKRIIGVVIYTRIGTKTSILLSEFEFWNTFNSHNKDCEFCFIAVSSHTKNNLIKNKHLIKFPMSIIEVYSESDLNKLNGLSGMFSYMPRNTFFGGSIDRPCAINYRINSYCTNELNLPLFIRCPDSEYPYTDYRKMAINRIVNNTPSSKKFKESNEVRLKILGDDYINYDNVFYIANGSKILYDWIIDIAHNDLSENMRMSNPQQISKNTIYVSDNYLFNVSVYTDRYKYLSNEAKKDKFIFIGYLQGSVAKNRVKVLNKMFKIKTEDIPIDIIGPGADELKINRKDIMLIDNSIFGDDYFETLNEYLAYIFIGKGNPINKYINKTVYDCMSAKCPIVVYSPCDKNGLIFKNKEYYFETEADLKKLYIKLKNPQIRSKWIEDQAKELNSILETKMDPLFFFKDYCKTTNKLPKIDLKINTLF